MIYTGIADANGDFLVPFSSSYTSGEKIIVTAEKDNALKTIELFAPTNTVGGDVIQFSGTLNNFPVNVGIVTIARIIGAIKSYAFAASGGASGNNIWNKATGLVIDCDIETIEQNAFSSWTSAKSLTMPESIKYIGDSAFNTWNTFTGELKLPNGTETIGASAFQNWTQCTAVVIGGALQSIGTFGFGGLTNCNTITVNSVTPPVITSNTFNGLKSTCIFKVPAASVAAYQAAANWSVFASRIQAI